MAKRNSDPLDNWMTTTEAAALLGVTTQYIRKLIAKGVFEARWISNRLLVSRDSLANWSPKRDWRRGKPRGKAIE